MALPTGHALRRKGWDLPLHAHYCTYDLLILPSLVTLLSLLCKIQLAWLLKRFGFRLPLPFP